MRLIRIYLLFLLVSTGVYIHAQSPITLPDSAKLKSLSTQNYPITIDPNVPNSLAHKDSLPKFKTPKKDSLRKKFLSNPTGTISVGYDYGVIPFASNLQVPMGYFKTEGNGSFRVLKLPFNASYFYSTLKNISGLNNYFRISYDAPKYREILEREKNGKIDEYKKKLSELEKLKQAQHQKLFYLQQIASNPNYNAFVKSQMGAYKNKLEQLYTTQLPAIPDTGQIMNQVSDYTDSLNQLNNVIHNADSLALQYAQSNPRIDSITSVYSDSLRYFQNLLSYSDSAQYYTNQVETKINELNTQIDNTNQTIEGLKNTSPVEVSKNYMPSKVKYALNGIQKFDIGMCYPSHSMFLVNGVALKGINTEYAQDNVYFAFTAGKTVNNLLFTNNSVQNSLQNVRNLYNYFDFNNVIKGRNVIAIKTGYGKPEGSHIFVGAMHGLGYSSYLIDSTLTDAQGNDKERNWVLEFDARYKYKSLLTLDFNYGKSSLVSVNEVLTEEERKAQSLINPLNRSNALQGKAVLDFAKTKSKFTASGRFIDPYFTSFGVYFIRKDNLRYEFRYDQSIGKKLKLMLSYRKDQNNLLNLFSYYNNIQTFGSSITYKVNKRLTLRAIYNPVIQKISDNNEFVQINKNNISNFIVSYTPRAKKISNTFNAVYSYYHLTIPSGTNEFQNGSLNYTMQTKSGFRNTFSASWFKSNMIDTLNNNTFLLAEEAGVVIKQKVTISAGGKLSLNKSTIPQIGYSFKINAPIYKKISFELSAEKLVLGDFYNSFNYAQITKFPYYGYGKLIASF